MLSGTPRDTLHFVELICDPHGGPRPEVLISDQGSYSDLIFGIVTLLGLTAGRCWPTCPTCPTPSCGASTPPADYGYLDRTARGRSDLGKIARHWPDIVRVITTIHIREISAHDAIGPHLAGGRRP
ncbi:Tn3 family transposase [Sphaerisporangium flaviroseum]|uniref:Tn3 family transposase n=1 Tax=Sphaerisporangium flaviroseum TaxID=509199 RepID=UPI0031E66968